MLNKSSTTSSSRCGATERSRSTTTTMTTTTRTSTMSTSARTKTKTKTRTRTKKIPDNQLDEIVTDNFQTKEALAFFSRSYSSSSRTDKLVLSFLNVYLAFYRLLTSIITSLNYSFLFTTCFRPRRFEGKYSMRV